MTAFKRTIIPFCFSHISASKIPLHPVPKTNGALPSEQFLLSDNTKEAEGEREREDREPSQKKDRDRKHEWARGHFTGSHKARLWDENKWNQHAFPLVITNSCLAQMRQIQLADKKTKQLGFINMKICLQPLFCYISNLK